MASRSEGDCCWAGGTSRDTEEGEDTAKERRRLVTEEPPPEWDGYFLGLLLEVELLPVGISSELLISNGCITFSQKSS